MVRVALAILTLLLLAAGLWCLPTPSPAVAAEKASPTFAQEGVAFLQKHCLACHNDKVKRADVSLHTFRDEASLVKQRKLWQSVLDVVKKGEMPPNNKPRPTQAEIDTFVGVIRGTFERADRNAKPDPGRVTVRRLNRTEYNNTIRDLVGIDFLPAEDFPADDIGHGFDNIGDVLSLSPVLLERYLAAAESIMQRAIVVDPPKPPERWMGSRYLEPATSKEFKWRPLDARGNELHTPYKLSLAGEYTFRVRAFAKMIDGEPVRVAVYNGKQELKQFEVRAPKEKPVVLEVTTQLPAGDHRFHVKLLNPAGGEEGRNLYVEWFYLRGPSDTRPLTQRRLLAVTPGKSQAEQSREVLSRFASRAYRRPATPEEVDRLVRLADAAMQRGDSWTAAMQLAMQAVLVSPRFLFRLELDDRPVSDQPVPLDEYQLASRLSYFLWSSMPDDELFELAGKKQLTANLEAQVARMLRDPRAEALVENFVLQWLQLRRLRTHSADPKLFPRFNEELRSAMLRETELFFAEIIRENRSLLDLIDGKFTYLNARLASHYGIRDTAGNTWGTKKVRPGGQPIPHDRFVRVELPDGPRGGILTHASVLTVTSNPTRTSPVKRGKWVLEQILGTPPPPPVPDAGELPEGDKAELTGTLRQRLEQHRKKPACAGCHAKMDPLGFAFENFDAIGAWRTKDGNFPIDAAATLPDGRRFQGPAELKQILKEKKDLVAACVTEKMLIYALGRGLEWYDRPTVESITKTLAEKDYRFHTLVTEIVKSLPFRYRRGKEPTS